MGTLAIFEEEEVMVGRREATKLRGGLSSQQGGTWAQEGARFRACEDPWCLGPSHWQGLLG